VHLIMSSKQKGDRRYEWSNPGKIGSAYKLLGIGKDLLSFGVPSVLKTIMKSYTNNNQ